MEKPATSPEEHRVMLGEHKAIAAVTYQVNGDKLTLGVLVHIPTARDEKLDKTYYKALGISTYITADQRDQIIKALGGTAPERKPNG